MGASTFMPAATSTCRPWLQKPRASWASLSSAGRVDPAFDGRTEAVRIPLEPLDIVSTPLVRERAALDREEVVAQARRPVEEVGRRVLERRGSEVDVRGVELVGLDGQGVEGRGGHEPASSRSHTGSSRSEARRSARPRSANVNGRSEGARRRGRTGWVVGASVVTPGSVPERPQTAGRARADAVAPVAEQLPRAHSLTTRMNAQCGRHGLAPGVNGAAGLLLDKVALLEGAANI